MNKFIKEVTPLLCDDFDIEVVEKISQEKIIGLII